MRLGIDMGGTAIKSGLVNEVGRVEFYESVPTNTAGGTIAILDNLIDVCLRQLSRKSVTSIGIGMPGRVDSQNGVVLCAANHPLTNIPLTQFLSEKLGLPVFIENDATCALYGEIFAGGGKNIENFLLVTVGTGIGGSIRIGTVYRGIDGRAGEFGHMILDMDGQPCSCGRIGCWEQYASASALCRLTHEAANAHPESLLARQIDEAGGIIDGCTVFTAIRSGCAEANSVLDEYARYLALGLNNLITIFRPSRVVLAGGIFREGETLLSRVKKHCIEPNELFLSTLNGQAGLIGASILS